jgi:hypothetical protein
MVPLGEKAQFSPVYAVLVEDINQDGIKDVLLGGNDFMLKPENGRYDALYGLFIKGLGKGRFYEMPPYESGISIPDAVRDIQLLNLKNGSKAVLSQLNNAPIRLYKFKNKLSLK